MHTYLIFLLSILIGSCYNTSIEKNGVQNANPKIYNCLIDSISKNDTLHIHFSTQGCFHFYTEQLDIYKKSDSLFAELSVSMPSREKLPMLTHYLNDSSIIAYAEFEEKGKKLVTQGYCTTQEQYMIRIKNATINFEDKGCEFEGYYDLKYKIFGQTKLDSYYDEIYR